MEITKNGTTIQSLQIGLSIVDIVAKQTRPLRMSDIQELTQITKSNLYKYLNTLTQLGLLYRDKEAGTYILGSKLIEYGMAAVGQENVIERITPYLQQISTKSNQTVLFTSWTPNGPMVVRIFNTGQGFNIGAQIGTLLPILSATGKIFAAFMEEGTIRVWKEQETQAWDENKKEKFKEECKWILEKGISFAREPLVSAVSSVAFPIRNYSGSLLGAAVVVGFTDSIPQDENQELSRYLVDISQEISASFGYKA
ncbi:IclR family transcriptional regulator [Ammoniphilus sp. YIM 78166]|uniref:IclR family transcriptional regulator n=1 Tax=Ammoniphilus sp. YIM 78166 TaxID=1644106 RepID=UPI00106F2112|nr:IclR family transcriptional regulator [Ammoniphilus sp. YIM 78166]